MNITFHDGRKTIPVLVEGAACPRPGEKVVVDIEECRGFDFQYDYRRRKMRGVVVRVEHRFSSEVGSNSQYVHIYLK